MHFISVSSSNIAAVAYDLASQILAVQFHARTEYHYFNVPPHLHQGLLNASSKGTFLNQRIKNRFPCRQVR